MILCFVEEGELSAQAVGFARTLGDVRAVTFAGAYQPAAWAKALAAQDADAIVAAGSDRGNELLAHVGAILDQPFAANVISLDGDRVTRVRWGGSLHEEIGTAAGSHPPDGESGAGHRGGSDGQLQVPGDGGAQRVELDRGLAGAGAEVDDRVAGHQRSGPHGGGEGDRVVDPPGPRQQGGHGGERRRGTGRGGPGEGRDGRPGPSRRVAGHGGGQGQGIAPVGEGLRHARTLRTACDIDPGGWGVSPRQGRREPPKPGGWGVSPRQGRREPPKKE